MLKRTVLILLAAVLFLSSLTGCYKTVDLESSDAAAVSTSDEASRDADSKDDSTSLESEDMSGDVTSINGQVSSGAAGGTSSTGAGGNGPSSDPGVSSLLPVENGGSKYERFRDHNSYGAKIISLLNTYWYSDAQGWKVKDNPFKSNNPVTLWGYGAYLEALGCYLKANPSDNTAYIYYLRTLDGLAMYKDRRKSNDTQLAYHCWADPNGYSEVFFDDNVWILLELIHAHDIFKARGENDRAQKYLSMAEQISVYILNEGWDDKLGGGLYWEDKTTCDDPNHPPMKGTCINAPMTYAATQLYKLTKKTHYKEWALKIYKWTMDNLYSASDNLFHDKIVMEPGGNRLDQTKYTYNVGNMVLAAAGLYEITGDAKYLNDSKKFAEGAFRKFIHYRKRLGEGEATYAWTSDVPWFNSSLIKGYMKLYEIDKDPKVADYLIAVRTSLADGCLNTADKDGYIASDWRSTHVRDDQKQVLDQAGTARCLFLIHMWTQRSGK